MRRPWEPLTAGRDQPYGQPPPTIPSEDRAIAKPPVSDAAVAAKTGKTWDEWCAILDAADGMTIGHTAIAAYLRDHHNVPPWWSQEVTVGYERIRGLRDEHQTPRGYQVSVSKTLPVAAEALYKAWIEEESRRRWLGDDEPHIRTARPNKSLRITWVDGATHVDVAFYPKGPSKSQVVVQHSKLADRGDVEAKRAYWKTALARLAGEVA